MQASQPPRTTRNTQYKRARAGAEKDEYRRAVVTLSSELLADTANTAVQEELARLHPSPSTPITPVIHTESLPPAPRTASYDVTRGIIRFDGTSASRSDGLCPSILQTLQKYSEGEDPVYTLRLKLTKLIQNFLDGKLPPDTAAHFSGAQITALWKPNA